MFTGIVEELGKVKAIARGSSSIKLSIECSKILSGVKLGDSIAVNGVCLTVADLNGNGFTADVMPETMRTTSLGTVPLSGKVNLERALRVSDRLGGHIVSGHIDGTGTIERIRDEDNSRWITLEASRDILKYIVLKGSVALDGTSLTVAQVDEACFSVSLIPLTLGLTTLGAKRTGDVINIEYDILGKYAEKFFSGRAMADTGPKGISMDLLKKNGFA